jgi:hypothetical protein
MTNPSPSKARLSGPLITLGILAAAIAAGIWVLAHEASFGDRAWLHYGIRVLLVGLCLAGWFLSQSLIGSRKLKDGAITDALHILFAPLHARLLDRPRLSDSILIVTSGFIDIFGLFLIGWSILGPSMRPFLALLILFIFRQISQALCALPAPPGMIWRYPGFPSLLVTYGTGNDFFFSGHTAIAVLGAVELFRIHPGLGVAAGVIALTEAAVVILLRAHYTMDVLGALAAVWCAVGISDWLMMLSGSAA